MHFRKKLFVSILGVVAVAAGIAISALRSGELVETYLLWRLEYARGRDADGLVAQLVERRSTAVVPRVIGEFERQGADRRLGRGRRRLVVAVDGGRIDEPSDDDWVSFVPGSQAVRLGAPAVPGLVPLLEAQSAWLRGAASRALVEIGAAAVPDLMKGLQSPDGQTVCRVAHVLARIGPSARNAASVLAEVAESDLPSVRASAVFALGRIGHFDLSVRATLEDRRHDTSGAVRRMAAEAVSAMRVAVGDDVDILDRLRSRLFHQEDEERARALRFLIGQFRSAQRWINPQGTPDFPGEIFARIFGASDRFAPALAWSWKVLLEELGCRVSPACEQGLVRIVEMYVSIDCWSGEDDLDVTECNETFSSFARDLRDLLAAEDVGRLDAFLRELHLLRRDSSAESNLQSDVFRGNTPYGYM